MKEKKPVIGLAGIIAMLLSCGVCGIGLMSDSPTAIVTTGVIIFLIGFVVFIYALLTGNLTLFGR